MKIIIKRLKGLIQMILDFERSDECTGLTIICFFFVSVSTILVIGSLTLRKVSDKKLYVIGAFYRSIFGIYFY